MTDELVAFLKDCVDEDERVAQAALGNFRHDAVVSNEVNVYLHQWNPVRVLAEVAAKRRIIDRHDLQVKEYPARFDSLSGERIGPEYEVTCGVCGWASMDPTSGCETLRLLAAVYAGRPGWQEEWAADEEATP